MSPYACTPGYVARSVHSTVTADRLYMSAMELGKLTRVACTGDKILEASGMLLQIVVVVSTIVLFNDNRSGDFTTYPFGHNMQWIIIRSAI